jgi:hypothetical protein
MFAPLTSQIVIRVFGHRRVSHYAGFRMEFSSVWNLDPAVVTKMRAARCSLVGVEGRPVKMKTYFELKQSWLSRSRG